MAALGASLAGWANQMQSFAGEVAQNVKECPQCGEVVSSDHKFCPKCGAKLPDQTMAAGYLCPKCGKQNLPGTVYCAECGAVLPAGEEEAARQAAEREEEARLAAEEAARIAEEQAAAEKAAAERAAAKSGSDLGGLFSGAAKSLKADEAFDSAKNVLHGLFGKK
jgi:ribosomal protein L32